MPLGSYRSWGLLAAALLLGLAAGAWAMRLYFDRTLVTWDPAERFVLKLGQDLDLNADQREKVALILAEQKARMELRRQAWRIEVRTLAREGEDQISRLLTPAQAERFVKLNDQIHGRMDRFLWTSEAGPTAQAIGPGQRR
jgi:hypothetical protein